MSWETQGRQEHGWFGTGTGASSSAIAQVTAGRNQASAPAQSVPAEDAVDRYVADNPTQWAGRSPVGSGERVALVRAATGAPPSSTWRPGAVVKGDFRIHPGTAIATFDSAGHYVGHAAIDLGQDSNGIQVIDQWNVRDEDKRIIKRHAPGERPIFFNEPKRALINCGESYRLVE